MSRVAFSHPSILPSSICLGALFVLLSTLVLPASANIAPDAMVYFNVQPLGPPEEYCQSEVTDCSQLEASTDQEGPLEFQIYIEPQQWLHGAIPVTRFTADLSWPEEWTLIDGAVCREGDWSFDPWGPGPHPLEIIWPCTIPDGLFLALTLAFDVNGYGRFELAGTSSLRLGCPPSTFYVHPASQFAEAGTGCEYTNEPCVYSFRCIPRFDEEEIPLSALPGETAHEEVPFTAGSDIYPYCTGIEASTEANWLQAQVVAGEHRWEWVLVVDADATGLEPGVHECELQVEASSGARCLQAVLTVDDPASIDGLPSEDTAATKLELRLIGANPSEGPFVFLYDSPIATGARCAVYDAAGREIALLRITGHAGGRHTITWNADDADGRTVAPGVYLIRLTAGGEMRSSRVVVVR